MEIVVKVEDKTAQENVRKLWTNRVDVTKVVNQCLANLSFKFDYNVEPVTICHQLIEK